MSRVRILNIPNDCTEEQLKQHLLQTAPKEAPLLEITDVQFIRRPATAMDRHHHHKQQKQRQGSIGTAAPSKSPKTILRMAFVGFRTSAAGHFVAQYFDGSYLRSAKLKVEVAKGLNEVGVTLNQLRKQQQQQQQNCDKNNRKSRVESAGGVHTPTLTSSTTPDNQATTRKRARDDAAERRTDSSTSEAPADGLVRRQREFVALRSKATEGPTWAAEVLLAPDAPPTGASDDEAKIKTAVKEETLPQAEKRVPDGSNADGEGETEMERLALSRQQALGEVSDMEFLAGLAGAPTHSVAEAADVGQQQDDSVPLNCDNDEDGNAPATANNAETPTKPAKKHESTDDVTSPTQEAQEEIARASRRIRLGNIPYIATEEHLKQFASSLVGPVEAVHIPLTKDTRQNKGAAFVRFTLAEDAVRALQLCRGAILMGRLLRVSAAEEDPHSKRVMEREAALASTAAAQEAHNTLSGANLAGSSNFKKQREAERRNEEANKKGGAAQMTWNTMYMNSHAAVETVAQRMGVRPEDVVGVGAKGAAVRAAIAEAYLTSEVQQVLSDEGVAFDVLESATQNFLKPRSNTTILVKNLQLKDGNDASELTRLFVRFGVLETSAFPSSGVFALFRYTHPQDARIAFTRLSYKLFKTAPLFLEWAPVGALVEDGEGGSAAAMAAADLGLAVDSSANGGATDDPSGSAAANAMVYTLFITNIPFQTTEDELHTFLLDTCPRIARAPETLIKRLVLQQDQGRAFLTVADQSTLTYCMSKLNGKSLAGRTLSCVVSKQTTLLLEARAVDTTATQQGTAKRPAGANAGGGGDDDDDDDDPTKAAVLARRRGHDATANHSGSGAAIGAASMSRVPPGCDPLKLIVKNLPFEANEKDVRELFSAFSEIRTVRVPRKSHTFSSHRENNHRGFAFVEFLSEAEATRALETLKATHLYGRHLVLQYAKLDG
ncbi:hypothetical protein JKF63_07631 [Porcisia hertigi]|uniref:RRM domain-containing protein n=1 Tax=Porcisia hertigi TaxID=2761500 RepID=A0A836IV22_9TRYP|nr:hypothetical protein JKF63_07631 [Porcisia hertigi]